MFSQPRKPHSLWPSKSLTTHHDHLNGREKNIGATELRCFVSGSRSEPLNLKVWRFEVSRIEFNHPVGWTYAQVELDDFFQFSGAPIPKISETTIYRSVRFREPLKLISARIKMRNGLKHWNHHTREFTVSLAHVSKHAGKFCVITCNSNPQICLIGLCGKLICNSFSFKSWISNLILSSSWNSLTFFPLV